MPRILDLFCKAGGCSVGYHRAGFEVVGVDIDPQPNYPYEFVQADALAFSLEGFDAVHASPPCQMFTRYRRSRPDRVDNEYVNLIPQTRELLRASGLPYVIENVVGAPLENGVKLCGSMFDPPLDVQRHRLFEVNWDLQPPMGCRHKVWPPNRYPGGRSKQRTGDSKGLVRNTVEVGTWDIPLSVQKDAMGVDWHLTREELSNAIPPAYCQYIGQELRKKVLDIA